MSHRKKRHSTIAVNEFAFFVVQARSIGFLKWGRGSLVQKILISKNKKEKKRNSLNHENIKILIRGGGGCVEKQSAATAPHPATCLLFIHQIKKNYWQYNFYH